MHMWLAARWIPVLDVVGGILLPDKSGGHSHEATGQSDWAWTDYGIDGGLVVSHPQEQSLRSKGS